MTFGKRIYLAVLPLMITASCVPPAGWSVETAAMDAAAPEALPDVAPPPSSLGRLSAADEALWEKAADQFTAPSAVPASPFAFSGDAGARGRALDCLATAIYYEARSESIDGQRAVAQVVLNRARHPAFPSSVCGVVYQGSSRRTGCQFSFTCDGSLARRPRGASWDRARALAAAALDGEVYAPVGNATHYHTTAILPYWAPSLTRAAVIGAHIFYRWRGAAGRSSAFRQEHSGLEGVRVTRAAVRTEGGNGDAGSAEVQPVERVRVETGTVTIHRGGALEAQAKKTESFGVRIHRGTMAPPPPPAS